MKSTFFITAAASAGLVAAQNLTGEPDCAIPCLSTAIAAVCTPASDQGCACASQGAIGQAALSCLLSNCDGTGLTQAQSAGAQLCVDYSATATGAVSTSSAVSSANATVPLTTAASTGNGTTAATSAAATTGSSARTTTSRSSTGSSTATNSASSSTSSAGANGINGVVAAQAGLLGALLAGVAAVL